MINIEQKIKAYLENGINCIAVDEHKRPFSAWKQYQNEHISPEVLISQIADIRAAGIAIICGKISGNLEVIDIDCKYDLTGTLYADLIEALPESIAKKMLVIRTKNNGYHLYYRCKSITGNKKLAQRKATPEEATVGDKVLVLIETRGEGGYVVAPPTEGYTTIQNNQIEVITEQEREIILSVCESFNQLKDEVKDFKHMHQAHHAGGADITPWADYNQRGIDDILSRLSAAGWKEVRRTEEKAVFLRPGKTDSKSSGDFNFTLGWFSVFTTSSEFHPNKAYRPSDVFCVLEKIKDGGELYKRLRDLGYGSSEPRQLKKVAGKKNDDDLQAEEEELIFFEESRNNIKILSFYFLSLLSKKGGFGLYRYDSSKDYTFIRVVDGIVAVASIVDMKKFTEDYIDTVYETPFNEKLKQAVQAQADKLFSKGTLEFLPFVTLNLLQHTRSAAYFPFKNGVLKITAEEKVLTPYHKIEMHVWRSHIIDFNYNELLEIDYQSTDFFQFISKICNDEPERIIFAGSVIGYLLHTYKDKARPYAVILAEETENEETGGGTGKGIFFRALSRIINAIVVDGKSFKHDKPFLFQRADIDTQLIVIDDCRKNIDFQGFYSHISEGLTIEKKNRDEIHIPYEQAPKFLFSTNYTINIDGTHGRRRALVVEFSNFFNEANTPLSYFGHMLFDGWNQQQWNEFYAVIALFVQTYLMDGVVQNTSSISIKRKEIINRFGREFLEFWDDIDKPSGWLVLNDLYASFLTSTDSEKKEYSARRFSAGLNHAAQILGYQMEVKKNRQNGGKRDIKIEPKNSAPEVKK